MQQKKGRAHGTQLRAFGIYPSRTRVKTNVIGVGAGPAGPALAGPLFRFNDIHLINSEPTFISERERAYLSRSDEPFINDTYRNALRRFQCTCQQLHYIRCWIAHARSQC